MKMPAQPYITDISLWYIDLGDCKVWYDYQPPEDDTNTAEGVEITSIVYNDCGDIVDSIGQTVLKELETEILDYLGDWGQGYAEDAAEARREAQREERHGYV